MRGPAGNSALTIVVGTPLAARSRPAPSDFREPDFNSRDAAFHAGAGNATDICSGRCWMPTPSFSVGGFEASDGKYLGGPIAHPSNAGIYDSCPGEAIAVPTCSIPVTDFDR